MPADLFDLPVGPEGFVYREGFVTAAEEAALLACLETLDFRPFQFQGFEGRRHVVSFGLKYDFNGPGLVGAEPLPDWLLPLRDRAAAFAGLAGEAFAHVLINRYAIGAPIGWHRDRPVFDRIVGVSLAGPGIMRFRQRAGTAWRRTAVSLAPRSAYLLDGPARRDWEHSLPEAEALRYSITFRNLRD
ncbi:MAG: alpha-ketoglutarate-dependent dioxygenase AlkB [Phenylobacterium zucineum]|nr:MAG: alpha-ketoglutarate-dependent dioxygenase AlkB [Phenylobacterium zucineum]